MKPSLLYLPILLLPTIMADWFLNILVPETLSETARVWGKKTSEGEREHSSASDDPESGVYCLPHIDHCKTPYVYVAVIQFSKPTVNPRPINITMGGELLQVSSGPDSAFTAEAVVRNHYTTKR